MQNTGPGPYAAAARAYFAARWGSPLPLPARRKKSPPEGWTGEDGAEPSAADVEEWITAKPRANIAVRLAEGVAGIDVDAHKGPAELAAWLALVEANGPLPGRAPWSTSRDDRVSGIRLLRVPPGYIARGVMPGGAGEVIQRHHRYVVAPPSIHPTGRPYRWVNLDDGRVPQLDDLPWLPEPWLAALAAGTTRDGRRETGWTDPDTDRLVTEGIPGGTNQDDVLRDVVYKLADQGETKAAARRAWLAIVSHTKATRPGEPWTGADFERHWKARRRSCASDRRRCWRSPPLPGRSPPGPRASRPRCPASR